MNSKKRGADVLAYNCSKDGMAMGIINAITSIVDFFWDIGKLVAIFLASYWFFASAAFAERGHIGGFGGEVIAAVAVTGMVAWMLDNF